MSPTGLQTFLPATMVASEIPRCVCPPSSSATSPSASSWVLSLLLYAVWALTIIYLGFVRCLSCWYVSIPPIVFTQQSRERQWCLVNFSIVQATNVSLVYIIDSYRPVAGEIVVCQIAFKSIFGFLLSFYTNPWVDEAGYSTVAMAGISGRLISIVMI